MGGLGEIVVYSCYFGKPEDVNTVSMGDGVGYRRVMVTDDKDLCLSSVEILQDDLRPLGPVHASRRAKLMPHKYFPRANWCIYVDNRVSLKVSPVTLIQHAQAQFEWQDQPIQRMAFRHGVRRSVLEELDHLYAIGRISRSDWKMTNRLFMSAGVRSSDLTMNSILVQKMGDSVTDEFNERWYEVFLTLPSRDQLALPLVEHSTGLKLARSPLCYSEFVTWPAIPRRNRAVRLMQASDRKPRLFSLARIGYKIKRLRAAWDIQSAENERNTPVSSRKTKDNDDG
ncbi:uncharacterized protein DUF616 [Primorskyibacter sedentarius]|uniref:Uncharacterized protein DUF616 n=1 Tax=Primorskyibacter sedentarius TaxID=745311 RepID=A0A4R3J2P5_9RHOB|nr:glycosyltransferase domain-containing protein [Primorskyibacter sedentarius]TCS59073.1 uncharacterized protein DUF616 [Primorskyibacter sedentarius]